MATKTEVSDPGYTPTNNCAASVGARQLAAAGGDVDAAALAHGAGQAILGEDLLEAVGGLAVGRRPVVALRRVERDQVHLRRLAVQQATDGVGVVRLVILPGDQRPLVEYLPLLFRDVVAAGIH